MPMEQMTGLTVEPDTISTSVHTEDEADYINILLSRMFSSIQGITWQDKLDTLAKCDCCERHQIDKPTPMTPWVDTHFNNTENTDCICNCRHTARFICRQFEIIDGVCVPCDVPCDA